MYAPIPQRTLRKGRKMKLTDEKIDAMCPKGWPKGPGRFFARAIEAELAVESESVAWNRKIRDSVDDLLVQAVYKSDSSVRNQLACMNFTPQPEPCPRCAELAAEILSSRTFLTGELSAALAKCAELQDRYDCNTAIMHARTKKMNEYSDRLTAAEAELRKANSVMSSILCAPCYTLVTESRASIKAYFKEVE